MLNKPPKIDHILYTVVLVGYISGMSLVVSSHLKSERNEKERNNLYQKVAVIADTNKDHYTNREEWAQVYGELGFSFDSFSSNPRIDLRTSYLERYLENHE